MFYTTPELALATHLTLPVNVTKQGTGLISISWFMHLIGTTEKLGVASSGMCAAYYDCAGWHY